MPCIFRFSIKLKHSGFCRAKNRGRNLGANGLKKRFTDGALLYFHSIQIIVYPLQFVTLQVNMKPSCIINMFLVALSVMLAPHAAAQTDTVAIVSEKGEDCYAAAAIKNGEGCLKYADTQGMFLCDSSLVMTGAYMKWQKVYGGDAGGFMLLAGKEGYVAVGGNDGMVNMTEFVGKESAAVFTEKDGRLSVNHNGSEMNLVLRQYTRSGKKDMDFCFVEKARVDGRNYFPARTYPMSSPGNVRADGLGGKIFEGRFNSYLVSQALDSATTSIDFTKAVLPEQFTDFKYTAATNCIVYIPESFAEKVPREWRNVVSVGENGAHLIRKTELCDGKPFHAPLSFTVGRDSLTYTRVFPHEGWNTLVLPFTVSETSEETEAYVSARIKNGEVILGKSDSIKALTPYLVRFERREYGNSPVTFTAAEGTEVSSFLPEWENGKFNGTLQTIRPTSPQAEYLFLGNDGYTFSPAAEGSFLLPFRCGFMFIKGEETRGLRLAKDGMVGVKTVADAQKPQMVYDINGMRMNKTDNLPEGIFIINGKKIYKKKQ